MHRDVMRVKRSHARVGISCRSPGKQEERESSAVTQLGPITFDVSLPRSRESPANFASIIRLLPRARVITSGPASRVSLVLERAFRICSRKGTLAARIRGETALPTSYLLPRLLTRA